jgi:sulfate adenylyltransferase
LEFSNYCLSPDETRSYFKKQGWSTVVGFQTRNVPHRAHEYLLRRALEQADGLFIQPLVGTKKRGDYTHMAILTAYRALIDEFLPKERILLGVLSTAMRYAGPREALLHAIIRRNHGCSHFIVGRDHAGVGDFYGKYEAQELTRHFDGELGIQILRLPGPFHCTVCDEIVTEKTCPHAERAPDTTQQVSGTLLRSMLMENGTAAPALIRPEIVKSIRGLQIFIDEEAE